jgi:AAA domain, putative AbiEii toxin, Type IV TA system
VRLVSFALQNYRSIKKAEKIALGDLTILIGPNNEGKSNILRGLVVGMRYLSRPPTRSLAKMSSETVGIYRTFGDIDVLDRVLRHGGQESYDWERDFPISLQEKSPSGRTSFDFEFELTSEEIEDFRHQVKSSLNGLLPIRLTLDRERIEFEVRKRGPGAKTLTAKRNQIAHFLAERIELKDIPSVRTASSAMRLVDEMVGRELATLERTDEYRAAVDKVAELQAPGLDALSETIQGMLSTFLPDVKSVKVEVEDRYGALRRDSRIVVDDGTATELRYKGDGVQSLAAISLIHHLSQEAAGASELVLAVEEPEAHLHPRAIHQLRHVLQDIASRQQVVLTTHSPLLVNRNEIGSNVIVDRSRARPARSVQEIRKTLGVRVSDNLAAAELVVVVEGEHDRMSLTALLREHSSLLRSALDDGLMALDSLHGATNLMSRLSYLRDQLCRAYVFLDHDNAGVQAARAAEVEGLLEPGNHSFATSPGMKESELEDLYTLSCYAPAIKNRYNVELDLATFRTRRRKWSERVKRSFHSSGKHWDDSVLRQVKNDVSRLVEQDPANALFPSWRSAFDGFVGALETHLRQA